MRSRITFVFAALGWLAAIFLLSGCPLIESENAGQVWYVNHLASGAGDGLSWAGAFATPQEAMDAAVAGDEVWVAEGVYGPGGYDGTPVLVMAAGIRVYGGFAGGESTAVSRDPAAHVTVLDGEHTAFHVVIAADKGVIDGFMITGGSANGSLEEATGGGIFISSSSVTIQNCRIEKNSADHAGGGIYNDEGVVLIIDSVLSGNDACYGGALENFKGSALVINTSFSKNRSWQNGGAVSNYFSSPVFVNSVFSGNETTFSGGAVFNYNGSPVFTNCTFTGNRADEKVVNSGAWAIGNLGSSPTIINSLLWANRSGDGSEITTIQSSVTVRYSNVQGGYAGSGNMDQPPVFTDDGSWSGNVWIEGDYHQVAESPLIDGGTSEGAPNFDKDGNLRPQGLSHDIGAFEYISLD